MDKHITQHKLKQSQLKIQYQDPLLSTPLPVVEKEDDQPKKRGRKPKQQLFSPLINSLNPVKNLWHLWSLALGEKAHKKDHVADKVAVVRTIIFVTYFITNAFIVAGVLRHWNDEPAQIIIEGVPNEQSDQQPRRSIL